MWKFAVYSVQLNLQSGMVASMPLSPFSCYTVFIGQIVFESFYNCKGKQLLGISRKSVGIAIDVSDSEQEKFLISHTSEVRSEEFNFCIERLRHCVRGAVVVEVQDTIVVFIECCRNHIERMERSFLDFVVPPCH